MTQGAFPLQYRPLLGRIGGKVAWPARRAFCVSSALGGDSWREGALMSRASVKPQTRQW